MTTMSSATVAICRSIAKESVKHSAGTQVTHCDHHQLRRFLQVYGTWNSRGPASGSSALNGVGSHLEAPHPYDDGGGGFSSDDSPPPSPPYDPSGAGGGSGRGRGRGRGRWGGGRGRGRGRWGSGRGRGRSTEPSGGSVGAGGGGVGVGGGIAGGGSGGVGVGGVSGGGIGSGGSSGRVGGRGPARGGGRGRGRAAGSRVVPAALVGRRVEVYWPHEDEWFAGTITAWEASEVGAYEHWPMLTRYSSGISTFLSEKQLQKQLSASGSPCPLRRVPCCWCCARPAGADGEHLEFGTLSAICLTQAVHRRGGVRRW